MSSELARIAWTAKVVFATMRKIDDKMVSKDLGPALRATTAERGSQLHFGKLSGQKYNFSKILEVSWSLSVVNCRQSLLGRHSSSWLFTMHFPIQQQQQQQQADYHGGFTWQQCNQNYKTRLINRVSRHQYIVPDDFSSCFKFQILILRFMWRQLVGFV